VNTYATGEHLLHRNTLTHGTPTPRHRQAGHDYTVDPS
jgi:hypothetical protein